MVIAASLLWKRSLSGTLWVTPAPCNHVCVYRCLSAACQQTATSAGWRASKFPERSRSYFTSWWNPDHHIGICHTSPPGSSHFLRRIARQGFHGRVTVTPFRLTCFVLPQSILPPCTSVHHVYLAGQSRSSVHLEMELLEVVSHRCSPWYTFHNFYVLLSPELHTLSKIISSVSLMTPIFLASILVANTIRYMGFLLWNIFVGTKTRFEFPYTIAEKHGSFENEFYVSKCSYGVVFLIQKNLIINLILNCQWVGF